MKTYFALCAVLGAASLIGFEADPIRSISSSFGVGLERFHDLTRAYLEPRTFLGALSGRPIEAPSY